MRVRGHDILLLMLVFALAACSTKPNEEETGHVTQALAPFTTQACGAAGASKSKVVYDFPPQDQDPGGTDGKPPPKINIINETSLTTSAQITLRSMGLDEREIERVVETSLTVPPGQTDYTFSWTDVPIQSIGTQSALYVDVELVASGTGAFVDRATTPPLYYEFNSGYTIVTNTGLTPKDTFGQTAATHFGIDSSGNINSTPNDFDDVLGTIGTNVFNQSGRRWDPNGPYFVDYLPTNDGQAYHHGSIVLSSFDWGVMFPEMKFNEIFTNHPLSLHKICTTWRAKFPRDAFGDYGNTSASQEAPARYAPAALTSSTGTTIWRGALDFDGCTPLLARFDGNAQYILWQHSRVAGPSNGVDVGYGPAVTPLSYYTGTGTATITKTGLTIGTGFVISSLNGIVNLHPAWQDWTTNVMFTLAHAFARPDNGLTGYVRNPSFMMLSDTACPGTTSESCYEISTKTAYLAPFLDSSKLLQHDAQYKYIIGHLIGHAIQMDGMDGTPGRWDDPDAGDGGLYVGDNPTPAVCTCGHIDGGTAWCLQSRKRPQVAQGEGWANFYAARIWNDQAGSDCTFGEYKPFNTGLVVNFPPSALDCKVNPVKWMDNNCSTSGRGVEYDWMQFLTRINTGTGIDRSSITDIEAIYQPCKGTICNWSDITANATAHFPLGALDPHVTRITSEGLNTGVNH